MSVTSHIILVANDAANVDDTEQPLVEPSRSHRDSHIFSKRYVVAMGVCAQSKIKQALELDKRRSLGRLAQFCMGEVEKMGEVGRVGDKEATLEKVEARNETLVA